MEHTPGPWIFRNDFSIIAEPTPEGGYIAIADALMPKRYPSLEIRIQDWEANGRLIAAAPELLAACERQSRLI